MQGEGAANTAGGLADGGGGWAGQREGPGISQGEVAAGATAQS